MSMVASNLFSTLRSGCYPLIWVLLFASALPAQTTQFQLTLQPSEQDVFWQEIRGFQPQPLEKSGTYASFPTPASDSLCAALLDFFRQKSFLLASVDSSENQVHTLLLGPPMHWISLRTGTGFESLGWLENAGVRLTDFQGRPFRYDAVLRLEEAVLTQAENNGYPFASVWLDSVEVQADGSISAVLQMERKRFFVFKNLKINGDLKLPKAYLPHFLGIRPGMPYSRARVLRLRDQLRSLLFLEPMANPNVLFSGNPNAVNGEATVNLFLKKKRASRFDFVLGLLPQPESGTLLLTGSLSAAFQNALNLGERFSAELERLRPETQKVDIQASVPYLFGSPFGADGRLNIFRRDSTWTDAQGEAGISYLFAGGSFVKFFWENKTSSLQNVDTLAVRATRRLPPNLDYRQNGFGLELAFSKLDYRFNPRRGWSLSVKTSAGFNVLRRNNQIESLRDPADPDFDFSSLYDSLAGRAARYRGEFRGEIFLPMLVRSTLKFGLRGGGIFSEKPVSVNEQYRLGGNKLLRGFDEESLFATKFLVGTAEWRLLLSQNSYLAAFADWAYLENLTRSARVFLQPLGLGAGLNFETKAGIFGISAAVGRRAAGQGVDFRAAKFHLGYVSLF